MGHGTILERDSDHKLFVVTELGHVSTIQADDGEIDHVKWLWGIGADEEFISMTRGHSYKLREKV